MREIQNIKDKLEKDRFSAVTVDDGQNRIFTNFTKAKIQANFGSIDNFFKHIEEKYPNAVITERRQNGTVGGKINYKTVMEVKLQKAPEVQTPEYVFPRADGLGSPSLGLGMADVIGLNVDRHERQKLEIENRYLKEENDRLKKVEDEYKEFKLSSEYSDKKSQQNNDLISGLLNSPVVQNIAERLLAPKAPGLAQPQAQPQDEFVRSYLSLDENSKRLFKNAMYFSQQSETFVNEFFDLIEKYLNTQQNGTEN